MGQNSLAVPRLVQCIRIGCDRFCLRGQCCATGRRIVAAFEDTGHARVMPGPAQHLHKTPRRDTSPATIEGGQDFDAEAVAIRFRFFRRNCFGLTAQTGLNDLSELGVFAAGGIGIFGFGKRLAKSGPEPPVFLGRADFVERFEKRHIPVVKKQVVTPFAMTRRIQRMPGPTSPFDLVHHFAHRIGVHRALGIGAIGVDFGVDDADRARRCQRLNKENAVLPHLEIFGIEHARREIPPVEIRPVAFGRPKEIGRLGDRGINDMRGTRFHHALAHGAGFLPQKQLLMPERAAGHVTAIAICVGNQRLKRVFWQCIVGVDMKDIIAPRRRDSPVPC